MHKQVEIAIQPAKTIANIFTRLQKSLRRSGIQKNAASIIAFGARGAMHAKLRDKAKKEFVSWFIYNTQGVFNAEDAQDIASFTNEVTDICVRIVQHYYQQSGEQVDDQPPTIIDELIENELTCAFLRAFAAYIRSKTYSKLTQQIALKYGAHQDIETVIKEYCISILDEAVNIANEEVRKIIANIEER